MHLKHVVQYTPACFGITKPPSGNACQVSIHLWISQPSVHNWRWNHFVCRWNTHTHTHTHIQHTISLIHNIARLPPPHHQTRTLGNNGCWLPRKYFWVSVLACMPYVSKVWPSAALFTLLCGAGNFGKIWPACRATSDSVQRMKNTYTRSYTWVLFLYIMCSKICC
jgi:hypothetical protein